MKCKSTQAYLPVDCIYQLSEKLNFHFEDLMTPDFKLLHDPARSGNQLPIPEKYTIASYSKLTPTTNIIAYLEKTRGPQAKINLLRKFQLSEDYFLNEQNRTNIHLISDVVKYLAGTYQFSENEFINMGKQTPFSATGKIISQKMAGQTKINDIVEFFFTECGPLFDKNCDYRITDIVNDFAIMEAIPNKDVMEELKIKPHEFGNETVCLTKLGCISSFSWFNFKRYARVEKLTSVYEGDATNKYLIDLAPFKKLSSLPSADILEFKPLYH